MPVNHYDYNDNTQLSPHFNAREFRCQCGQSHETLIASELVDKLEQLYAARGLHLRRICWLRIG